MMNAKLTGYSNYMPEPTLLQLLLENRSALSIQLGNACLRVCFLG